MLASENVDMPKYGLSPQILALIWLKQEKQPTLQNAILDLLKLKISSPHLGMPIFWHPTKQAHIVQGEGQQVLGFQISMRRKNPFVTNCSMDED